MGDLSNNSRNRNSQKMFSIKIASNPISTIENLFGNANNVFRKYVLFKKNKADVLQNKQTSLRN